MHIADGLLDARTAAATAGLAVAGLAVALRQAKRHLPPRRVPLMGLAAAFVFAAQLINFPVIAGTSGHLIGGVLAAVLLGPGPAVIVLAAVLIVQCLLFADGGLSALGANVFNMALVSAVGGYAIYHVLTRVCRDLRGRLFAAAFAAWCGTVLAAIACAAELAASGTAPWSKVFPAMAVVHMLIGVGEALITALVLLAVARTRPELLEDPSDHSTFSRYTELALYGVLVCLGLAMFLAPFASSWPDGLQTVARQLGFEHRAAVSALPAPLPDYQIPGIGSAPMATAIAGGIGTVLVFSLALVLARVLVPQETAKEIGPCD